MRTSTVSLVHGDDRYENIRKALELIEDEIAEQIKGKEKILIKPNFVSVFNKLCATHVQAVRGVLDVITRYAKERITVGEGPALGPAKLGFLRYGYYRLGGEYDLRFVNLNKDASIKVEISDAEARARPIPISKTVAESDFRISVCPMKTHDTVVATLSLKNMLVGSIAGGWSEKQRIHQGYAAINRILYTMARSIPPHLSVIDGFVAMEGNGPVSGDAVKMKVALASTDFLAADAVALHLMGIDLEDVGYLYYCHEAGLGQGDLGQIEVVGERLDEYVRPFKRHRSYLEQLRWKRTGTTYPWPGVAHK